MLSVPTRLCPNYHCRTFSRLKKTFRVGQRVNSRLPEFKCQSKTYNVNHTEFGYQKRLQSCLYGVDRFEKRIISACCRRSIYLSSQSQQQRSLHFSVVLRADTYTDKQSPLVDKSDQPEGPESGGVMKVLGVAEKNDASKRIAQLLSNGTAQTRSGFSVYNKLYVFPYVFRGQQCEMTMTSVSGHLLNYEFDSNYRKWHSCDPVELFDAPVRKSCTENMKEIKRTLEQQAAYHQVLIIWTDCDREGENIGYEVINVCQKVNPRLQILRAKFSEITKHAIERAMNNLIQPDKRVSDAVDVRQELDLRIGAAFTRFQTLRLTRKFASALADRLISYGSCQFPTLGFVVERYKAINEFVPEDFWKIDVTHEKDNLKVSFTWHRTRLFDQLAVQTIYEACLDNPNAKVIKVQNKPKSKWRPVALDTIEFEKLASRKLKIGAKEAMQIAEQLYTSGYISYPRTETNIFPPSLNLTQLVEQQTESPQWGGFATRMLQSEGPNPRNGKKSDQAHPPIHPTKFHNLQGLSDKHRKIYELVVRHFLACCSKDAKGDETIVEIELAEERFVTSGLTIKERNYLEVYIYDKWSDKELPDFNLGETFRPTTIEMNVGRTSPPNLLTEADLIALMEKHGIGTDATHAEHIETIKNRQYVGLEGIYFIPSQLGMGLVEGYDAMGFEMSKPYLRAQLELDLQQICEGRKRPEVVLQEQIRNYREVFIQASDQVIRLDEAIGRLLNSTGGPSAGGGGGGPPPRGPASRGPQGSSGRRGNDDDDDDDDNNGGGNTSRRGRGPAGQRAPRNAQSSRINSAPSSSSSANSGRKPISKPVPRPQSRPQPVNDENTFSGVGDGDVTCSCGTVPVIKTTRKEGPNQGRQFYRCDTCGFFKWVDEAQTRGQGQRSGGGASNFMPPPPARQQMPRTTPSNRNVQPPPPPFGRSNENVGEDVVLCRCKTPAGSYTVRKEGANKGRKFFGCTIPFGGPDRCDFFQWDDNPSTPKNSDLGQPQSRRGGFSANRGRGGGSRGGGGRRARKCGLCHQEGHTRRNCHLADGEDDEEEMDHF